MDAAPAAVIGDMNERGVFDVQAKPAPEIVNTSLPSLGMVVAGCKLMRMMTFENAFMA